MMILSKSNIQVVHITSKDKSIDTIDNIHICLDGTTIGCAGNIVFAVSPVMIQVKDQLKQLKETQLEEELTINSSFAQKLIKNMPKDTLLGGILEHCDIADMGGADIKAKFHDGQSPFIVRGKKYKGKFAPFRRILNRVLNNKDGSQRIVVNRARLLLLLEAFGKAAPGDDESVVFIEFTKDNDLILRAVNENNGQRLLATMKSYLYNKDKWLKHDRWELKLMGEKIIEKVKRFIYKRRM